MDEIADIFDSAAEFVEQLMSTQPGALTDDAKLELYGLYKQVTCGPCTAPKPGLFDLRGKAKW
jgi:acyl-CoA-binding protein